MNKYFNRIWNSFHYHIRPHSSVLTLLNSSMKCRAFLDFTTLLSRMLSDWLIRYLGSKLKTPFIGPPNILAEKHQRSRQFSGAMTSASIWINFESYLTNSFTKLTWQSNWRISNIVFKKLRFRLKLSRSGTLYSSRLFYFLSSTEDQKFGLITMFLCTWI